MVKKKKPKPADDTEYRCQHCGYEGPGWLDKGQECPECHGKYDYLMAQDEDD